MSRESRRAIVGIDIGTRKVVIAAEDTEENWMLARQQGLIVVPVSGDVALDAFNERIDDVIALARKGVAT